MARKHPAADADLEAMLAGNDKPPEMDSPQQPLDEEDVFRGSDTDQSFEFDFAGTGDIENGPYPAKVQEFLPGISQAGNPKYDVKFYLPTIKRSLDLPMSLMPAALWKTGAYLRALGVGPESERSIGRFTRAQMIGKLCYVEIKNEPYEGRSIPKIVNVSPSDADCEFVFETAEI